MVFETEGKASGITTSVGGSCLPWHHHWNDLLFFAAFKIFRGVPTADGTGTVRLRMYKKVIR